MRTDNSGEVQEVQTPQPVWDLDESGRRIHEKGRQKRTFEGGKSA